jgi:hypothetical protein
MIPIISDEIKIIAACVAIEPNGSKRRYPPIRSADFAKLTFVCQIIYAPVYTVDVWFHTKLVDSLNYRNIYPEYDPNKTHLFLLANQYLEANQPEDFLAQSYRTVYKHGFS